jgi:hypothetical protein
MKDIREQGEFFGLVFQPFEHPFRLRVNDIIRSGDKLGRVVRVTESAAVILMNRPRRDFKTRFDKPVRFQPAPFIFRISANSESEILNRKAGRKHKQHKTERRIV